MILYSIKISLCPTNPFFNQSILNKRETLLFDQVSSSNLRIREHKKIVCDSHQWRAKALAQQITFKL